MLLALNKDNKIIDVNSTLDDEQYFCPVCSCVLNICENKDESLYFEHPKNSPCSDSFFNEYPTDSWHNKWVRNFPQANQEIFLENDSLIHMADILIDRTAVLFRKLSLSEKIFNETNMFFDSLYLKTVWLIDLREEFLGKKLSFKKDGDYLLFSWPNPKKIFKNFNEKFSNTDIFIQLSNNDENSIVRILNETDPTFKSFRTTKLMSKNQFKNYVGMKNGFCPLPYNKNQKAENDFRLFKEKYNINLNPQQERAVKSIDGANLLLAVPGSGKTTVLINRIAYMILQKRINPKSILALTYNVSACNDMKERFSSLFADDVAYMPAFKTLNSISLQIYRTYCKKKNFRERELFDEKERTLVIRNIYRRISGNLAVSENDIKFLSSHFTYIKNTGLGDEEIAQFNSEMPKFSEMYLEYRKYLKANYKMDFDDQLVLAHWVLLNDKEILDMYKRRYKYICVDEAQDTSKIQHQIIALLAQGNNIFMVGDEDQSIYGFRAAYPQALLDFRFQYNNPYIQKMEYNYRSGAEICNKAAKFISKNTGRFKKNIIPVREFNSEVKRISVSTRKKQYDYLLDMAINRNGRTAFLYRDNASSVVLIDLFLRNNVPFIHRTADVNFFQTKTVLDIIAYITLILDPYDFEAFDRICNKGIVFLKNQIKSDVIKKMKYEHMTYYDAIYKSFPLIEPNSKSYLAKGLYRLRNIKSTAVPNSVIEDIKKAGYSQYMSKQKISKNNVEVLEILAQKELTLSDFLKRLSFLESSVKDGFNFSENPVILSTIHSSKGLEYKNVYMVDVFDGVFPSNSPSLSGKMSDEELEERRIFYVGITRAKDNLYLMEIKNCETSFINELFPAAEKKINPNRRVSSSVKYAQMTTKELNERRLQRQNQKIIDARCYNEVKFKFTEGVKVVQDSLGRDWVKCDVCHKIKLSQYFKSYSDNSFNECCKCTKE